MSWITRCPDCETAYKVATEQLKQAHGWLRCGACQHVFDSGGRVVAADLIPTLTERVNIGTPQLERMDLERLNHKDSHSSAAPLPTEVPEPSLNSEPSVVVAFEDALQSFKMPDLPVVGNQEEKSPVKDVPAEGPARPDLAEPAASPQSKTTPLAQWTLFVLVLLLALQSLIAVRPALQMHWPQVARLASQWCDTSTCRAQWLSPLTPWTLQVQSMDQKGDTHRLRWSLRHSVSEALPVPDLELRLLNAQEQLLSSIPLGSAMPAAPDSLSPGQVWEGSFEVDLSAHPQATAAQLRVVSR